MGGIRDPLARPRARGCGAASDRYAEHRLTAWQLFSKWQRRGSIRVSRCAPGVHFCGSSCRSGSCGRSNGEWEFQECTPFTCKSLKPSLTEFSAVWAYNPYSQNTKLVVSVDGTRAIDESALIVFASGGIQSKSGGTVMLTGDSLQTMVVVLQDGKARVLAFQNTRRRPTTDGDSASVWREFDNLWSHRHAKSNV